MEELDGLLARREGRLLAILGDTGPLDADVPAVVGVPGSSPQVKVVTIAQRWSEYSMVVRVLSGGQSTHSDVVTATQLQVVS